MKILITTFSFVTLLLSCNPKTKKTNAMDEQKKQEISEVTTTDTTPKVTGIGGVFFFSDNPEKTKEWYSRNLGIEMNEYGSTFESRNINQPDDIEILQWSIFKKGDAYFSPSKKDFMINYRVQHIESLVKNLKKNGVTILDSITTYDYGKFIHIIDTEGNKIELWEPAVSNGH